MSSEEALTYASPTPTTVTTPTGSSFEGLAHMDPSQIVVISIIRAADSMLDVFMRIVPEARVGKILIQV
jgi:uracil phosphoribosyltransferase